MSTLFCFGVSYTAAAYIARYGQQFGGIAGTVRSDDKARRLASDGIAGHRIDPFVFGSQQTAAALSSAIENASLILVSTPPNATGDPAIAGYADRLRRGSHIKEIVYLSTIGVYGDHAGAWIDETTPANPVSPRSRERLRAEQQWQGVSQDISKPLAILRLPGIYGPGRNALLNVTKGEARRIVKPGQVFNRIHVHDIAQAIEAAYVGRASGIFNICDDEPAPGPDPIVYAAQLLGVTPPPALDFDGIKDTMSPMGRSFYAESKRVRNTRMKSDLGVSLLYPSYREGLRALYDAGDATSPR